MTEDFYDLLDVSDDASQEEITAAFREQVRVYHPDLNDDDRARAQFMALKKAYDVLDDPVERQAYDRLGHETYVAKRTSGLPSTDVFWGDDDDVDGESQASETTDASETTSGGPTATGTDRDRTSSRTAETGSSRTSSGTGTASGTTTDAGSSATADGTRTAGNTAAGAGTAATGRRRETTSTPHDEPGTGEETGTETETGTGTGADTAFVQWVRGWNDAWLLIWASTLTYLAGLVHITLENVAVLSTLRAEFAAVGTDLAGIWTLLTSGRHGLDTPAGFVSGVELIAASVAPMEVVGAVAGVVALVLVLVVGTRIVRDQRGPVSTREMAAVAAVLGLATVLVGGPLLAGAVLMPLLFGWTIHRTRTVPGWSPSYGYVLAVFAPALGLAAGVADPVPSPLLVDLLAFVVLPLAGAVGLPLRLLVRRRFGR